MAQLWYLLLCLVFGIVQIVLLFPTFFELRHKMALTFIGPEVICAAISFLEPREKKKHKQEPLGSQSFICR